MSEKSIEKILQANYAPELPYGFAERVARSAMAQPQGSQFWELLFALTPKTGLALGAVAMLLAVVGFSGSGPGIVESVNNYGAYSTLLPMP
jgi:hypothetical protein